MRFDRTLSVGARGGHGPVRDEIEEYQSGCRIAIRFAAPRGFDGTHSFEVAEPKANHFAPRAGNAPLIIRPLHDALIEDSLDTPTISLGKTIEKAARWPMSVRLLRAVLRTLRGVRKN